MPMRRYLKLRSWLSRAGSADVRVSANADDKHENTSGTVTDHASTVQLSVSITWGAWKFRGLTVPAGATITSAYLYLTQAANANLSVTIKADKAAIPADLGTGSGDISSRTLTTANVSWSITADNTAVDFHQSPDLKTVIQEWVDTNGAMTVCVITLNRTANGKHFVSHNVTPLSAGRLVITWT